VAARVRRASSVAALAAAFLVTACAGTSGTAQAPTPVPATPAATVGAAAASTRQVIEAALGQRQVQLQDPQQPYRPAEPPAIAALPRAVYQAVLPDDPAHGYIVVYELPTEDVATRAAEAQAAYVGSSVGRVQFPVGTQFVVRVVGRTVVFYADPPESPDDQAADVVEALGTVGREVTVPG
jgi:hypothetical protein